MFNAPQQFNYIQNTNPNARHPPAPDKVQFTLKSKWALKKRKKNIWHVASLSLSLTYILNIKNNNNLQRKFKVDLTFARQTWNVYSTNSSVCADRKNLIKIFLKFSPEKSNHCPQRYLRSIGFHSFSSGSCHPPFVISNHCKLHLGFEPGAMLWLWAGFFLDVYQSQHGALWRTHKVPLSPT